MNKMVYRFGLAALVAMFTVSLLLAGCAGETTPRESQGPQDNPSMEEDDIENSIRTKLGVTATGKDGVTATFTKLHEFIEGGGLTAVQTTIKLGDWIDLAGGLTVQAYGGTDGNGGGAIDETTGKNYFVEPVQPPFDGYRGRRLRLIVVGINSFNEKNNNNTPHVVFQFQNLPVSRRMNPTKTNAGGYAASEMRRYLTTVEDDNESGKFLAGLQDAGVPVGVLWAPTRSVSTGSGTEITTITDLVWLPTEREMVYNGASRYGDHTYGPYANTAETADTQARLEYYSGTDDSNLAVSAHTESNGKRVKYTPQVEFRYWTASPYASNTAAFCTILKVSQFNDASYTAIGCAPAFCVK
jgi:hypothetical protein